MSIVQSPKILEAKNLLKSNDININEHIYIRSQYLSCRFIIMFNEEWKVVCAYEEERLNRIKHWAGIPFKAINECLKFEKINITDINVITINSNPYSNIKKNFIHN